jgi:hypothetical protein
MIIFHDVHHLFVIGYGASCDAYHITSPDPEGQGLKRAVLACLKDSQIEKEEVIRNFSCLHLQEITFVSIAKFI